MEAEAAAKRARESGDAAAAGAGEQAGISAVIPGWFSEISPMWPGSFRSLTLCSPVLPLQCHTLLLCKFARHGLQVRF